MTAPRRPRRQSHAGERKSPLTGRRQPPPSARWLAFLAAQAFEQRGAFVGKVLDDLFTRHRPHPRERRLATELASELIRRRLTLDCVLAAYVDRPRTAVEDDLWLLLRLGCCQLLCLSHIPPHAAVHETVNLCSQLDKARAKGFINGTLRSIEREILPANDAGHGGNLVTLSPAQGQPSPNDETKGEGRGEGNERRPSPPSPLPAGSAGPVDDRSQGEGRALTWPSIEQCAPDAIPILDFRGSTQSVRQVRLARRVFASADQDPLEFIAQSTSLPRWLLERWQAQQRDPAELLRLGLWFTTPGTMSLRVNLQQTIREKILDMLDAAEIPAQPGAAPEAIRLHGTVNAADLPGFRDGWFSVQDESALAAVELLNPQPGERILDLCAAPGGKACAAAERLAGTGEVIACDVSETRLELIRENASRLRLKNLRTELIPADGGSAPAGPFQAVLADVPCSNTGVLGKRPEARWRLTPASFGELIPLQRRLLELAIDRTAPGGRIVYSTCSIDEQENEQVVRSVLSGRGDVHLEREQSLRPGLPADGGYQALLRRD